MHMFSTAKQKAIIVLLVCILSLGWPFLIIHFYISSAGVSYATAGIHSQEGATTEEPSPMVLISPTHIPPQQTLHYSNTLLQLTAGLRSGPGVPIPAALDVHALPVNDISFYNWRGYLLSGWFALHTPQAPVIILAHGTPGNRVSMISRAAFLYAHGYNVLLFDFQSYGRSQGVLSTLGLVESEDILAAISYIHSLPATSDSKIGVLGLSMGATAAILAAARTRDIVALVAESCPVDATLVSSDVPNAAVRAADRELVEDVYGVDITTARPIDVVNKLAGQTALFFINGTADTVTPLAGMFRLYQAAGEPKRYWIVPTAHHAQSFSVATASYTAQVDTFFDTYLRYP
jgi:dipeptidyl aminopeptidase/acylaminoacyl peptidase